MSERNDAMLDTGCRVLLANRGNPDFGQDPSNPVFGNPGDQWVRVANREEASRICLDYISAWDLGVGSWCGGDVFEGWVHVGCISYGGRLLPNDQGPVFRKQVGGMNRKAYRVEPDLAAAAIAPLIRSREYAMAKISTYPIEEANKLGIVCWDNIMGERCETGQVMFAVEWGRDCNMAENTRIRAYPADFAQIEAAQENSRASAEGPWSIRIIDRDELLRNLDDEADREDQAPLEDPAAHGPVIHLAAHDCSDYGNDPECLAMEFTEAFVQRVNELSALCEQHKLQHVDVDGDDWIMGWGVAGHEDEDDEGEDSDLHFEYTSLRVCSDGKFWFRAPHEHVSGAVETDSYEIGHVANAVRKGEHWFIEDNDELRSRAVASTVAALGL